MSVHVHVLCDCIELVQARLWRSCSPRICTCLLLHVYAILQPVSTNLVKSTDCVGVLAVLADDMRVLVLGLLKHVHVCVYIYMYLCVDTNNVNGHVIHVDAHFVCVAFTCVCVCVYVCVCAFPHF